MSSQVRMRLLPSSRCLYDEPVQVKVEGLKSRQVVTMRARSTDERGTVFTSSATYRADANGEIDLNKDPSLFGSYAGVQPMGLLWSMRPETLHRRFITTNSQDTRVVKFSVHKEEGDGRMLAKAINERLLLGDGVCRIPLKEGNLQGVLFIPPGKGPFPAVLDLSTVKCEKRASLLANKGFMVLSETVFHDKMSTAKEIHLDRFKEAADFLRQHPKVGGKGVGVVARSKGGDVALSLASFVPGIVAVVWINGCNANVSHPLFYKQRQILSALRSDHSRLIPTESGAYFIKFGLDDPRAEENKDSLVPVEKAKAHFLFVASEDDMNWDSKAYMDMLVDRLRHHGKDNFECVYYQGAGHYLEPPYGPHCRSSYHGYAERPVLWGGEARSHAAAEVHLWMKIQEFFRIHLRCGVAESVAKL